MSGVSIATGVIATDALGGGQGRGLQSPGVLAQSAVPSSVTGTLTETVLATIAIPAGAMGASGKLRITALFTNTNSANNKVLTYRLGGTSLGATTVTTSASLRHQCEVTNRGVANSQITNPAGPNAFAAVGAAVGTSAVDTSAAQNLTITGTLANTGETITLEAYTVEILNP